MKIDWTPASALFPAEDVPEAVTETEVSELQTQEEPVDAPETHEEEPEVIVSDTDDEETTVEA